MRNKKKWSALVLAVIMVAAVTLSGCRKEREKINVGTENNTLVTTESESESETKKKESETKKESESTKETEKQTETKSSESDNTTQTEPANNSSSDNTTTPPANSNGGSSDNNGGSTDTGSNGGSSDNGAAGNNGGSTDTGSNGGSSNNNGGEPSGDGNGDSGNGTTPSTEAPRYFFAGDGSRVDVSQLPDGSWQDANGTSYTFYEDGVQDSNGNWFYYDPPATGNTSMEVGTQADFYDTQGNHIICTLDENGFWVDTEGNTYTFGEDGVTNNATGEFHPY